MNIKLFSDEKGVTPVIGVMLMIVVTVILAAAVSSFATSVDTQDAAPQATFTCSASAADGIITLEHLGGDTLSHSNVKAEIAAGTPLMTTHIESSEFTFAPKADYLRPGDTAEISFTALGGDAAMFNDIYVTAGTPFEFTLIDTDTGQTVYSTTVVLNP